MDSQRPSSSTIRVSRGMSVRVCMAKMMTWTFDSAKCVLAHDASTSKVSLPQVMWGIQEDHQTSENHKKKVGVRVVR